MVVLLVSVLAAALVVSNAVWWSSREEFLALHLKKVLRLVAQKRSELAIERGKRELAEAELAELKVVPWKSVKPGEAIIFIGALQAAEAELEELRELRTEEALALRGAIALVDKIQAKLDEAPWHYRRSVAEKMKGQGCEKTK